MIFLGMIIHSLMWLVYLFQVLLFLHSNQDIPFISGNYSQGAGVFNLLSSSSVTANSGYSFYIYIICRFTVIEESYHG